MGRPLLRSWIAAALLAASAASAAADAAGSTGGLYTHSIPDSSMLLPGRSLEQQLRVVAHAHLDAIEGVWRYTHEMMTVAVERFSDPSFASRIAYRIVLLESDDLIILPGTVIGYIAPSADSHKFEMWLYSERLESTLYSPTRLIATLDGGVLTCRRPVEVNVRVRVNFARFLPGIFKGVSIIPGVTTEELPVGFRRICPTLPSGAPDYGTRIRYL